MTKINKEILTFNTSEKQYPLRFAHKAMNTIFEIFIHQTDQQYAAQAANAVFIEIDRLEQELSRFNVNSDISRINALKQFGILTVGDDCYSCLTHCSRLYQQTKAVFDISAGFIVDLWKKLPDNYGCPDRDKLIAVQAFTGMPWLHILDDFQVQLMSEKISLDLGGYGKGYALRIAAELLRDWDIDNGLIHAGMSTLMPLGGSCWPVEIKHPQKPQKVLLKIDLSGKTISGSGIKKGQHIIDSRSGYPVSDKMAAWAIAPDPAESDALSTAFIIMSVPEIEAYCALYKVGAVILTSRKKIIKIGL